MGIARLHGCAVLRGRVTEGVARLRVCTVLRENTLCYSELIVM